MFTILRFTFAPTPSTLRRQGRRSRTRSIASICSALAFALFVARTFGNPPVAKYIFPAGGQRGTTVEARVGGCFFHGEAGFEMLGSGVKAPATIRQIDTIWFESPLIPQPASQQAEDYPKDYACTIKIAPDAEAGLRGWRAWTSQGATSAMPFVIGDLPEVVERETQGAGPVRVKLPVTINGRIFPRENVDVWTFHAGAGERITCDVSAKRLGSPLDAELRISDPAGKPVAAQLVRADGDPRLHFTAGADGIYQVRIHDVAYGGLQNYVYRLTISADPCVDHIYPLGGRRGSRVHFDLFGHALTANAQDLQLPDGANLLPESSRGDSPVASGGFRLIQFDQNGHPANAIRVAVDDLPEVLEVEPNDRPTDVKPVEIPVILNGRIDHPGDVDYWAIDAKKGQPVDMDLWAGRLGSPLDSVLSVEDASGKQLFRNDDRASGQPDSRLAFKAPADGIYYIRVEDRFASRGGKEFAYRLHVATPPPDFWLTLSADAITLPRPIDSPADATAKKPPPPVTLKVEVERLGGFAGPVQLTLDGLPDGVTADNAIIPARQTTALVKLTAAPYAKIAVSHLRVRGTADVAGAPLTHAAFFAAPQLAPMQDVILAVAMVTPFKEIGVYEHPFVPCGSIFHRRYSLDRGGFVGPITVDLADRQIRHLQGVWGPKLVIPDGADSFDYWVGLACEMELGRTSRAVIALTGTVKDFDGSEHVVSFSSVEPNDQFVSVATAPLINVGLDQPSVLAVPGGQTDLTVHVQRAKALLDQAVRVELILPAGSDHFNIHADPLSLDRGQSDGVLHIHFGSQPIGSPIPVLIQATAPGPKDQSQAQTHLEFAPQPPSSRTQS
ncbi:MAG TPA: PPC domain-containing protein [Tepidisphaeraceae bacterium]|nr:PPC domain-containing protein [Tepidisphaeraceae bacterium]